MSITIIDESDVRMWHKANWFGKTMFCITFPLKFVMMAAVWCVAFLFIFPMLYAVGSLRFVAQFVFIKRAQWKPWRSCIDDI